jgi:hypothetical protein
MKTSVLLFIVGALALPSVASAQDAIDQILLGAPVRLREAASVIKWNADYTHEVLKKGTNQLVCYARSGEGRRPAYAVQCTSMGNLDRVAQNRRFRAEGKTADGEKALVEAAEKNGTRVKPEYGAPWISTNGPDAMKAGTHTTIAVPGATAASTGLPVKPGKGGAWIMDAGTTTAHIMLPGQ